MPPRPRVSVVLPCYHEGSRIVASLATLESWFESETEILVVDDGSPDDTRTQAAGYANGREHIRVHRVAEHRGKGSAIRAAIPLVRGDLVVFMDADLAFDRDSVQRALEGLDTADVVVGNRRHERSRYSVPVSVFGFLYRRHLAGLVFNAFVRTVLGLRARDTQCGLKAFRRTALERIAPALSIDGFALDVEMLLAAQALRMTVAEIPVNVRYDSSTSSVKLVKSTWAMTSDIVRLAIRRARGTYAPERLRALAGRTANGPASRAD